MKPHVLIFNVDQWRGDSLGHLGTPGVQTPVIDRLVKTEAVSYTRNFCQNTVCVPSRCSFMSGWYPHTRGHRTMRHVLDPEVGDRILLDELRKEGYHVFWGGKNDVVAADPGREAHADSISDYSRYAPLQPNWHGKVLHDVRGEPGNDNYYSFYIGKLEKDPDAPYYRDDDWLHVQEAIRMVRERPVDKPLCLYLAITYPHPPYAVEEPFYSAIDREAVAARIDHADWSGKPALIRGMREGQGLTGWSEDRWRELRAVYYGMCMRIDALLGDLIKVMREEGIWDDTLMTFFSDHGDFTGDYDLVEKTDNTFEDCLSRVPLVVKPPKSAACRPGLRDCLTENLDVGETIFDFAGIDPGYVRFGRSLRDSLADPAAPHRDAVFCEGGRLPQEPMGDRHGGNTPNNPRSLYYPRQEMMAKDPAGFAATMCRSADWKYVRRMGESDELYNLREDPGETQNLIKSPEYREVLAGLRDRMLNWFQQTGSVLPQATARGE